MQRKITAITPVKRLIPKRKKVAAYARVSTGKDAMLHSLSAQISYYKSYIQSHGDWEFAGIYADEAITGTKETRPELQKMITACENGEIDMIITKSISRFARNTVTLLETVRKLKGMGIDVYFEEQNIHSINGDGELMLAILASFAQEESLSASENIKWRIRNDFKEGKPNFFSLYGYRRINGVITIVEEEAAIIKEIFELYLSGIGSISIAKILNKKNIQSPTNTLWCSQSVVDILKNEKYMGDMLLQKYYTKDHISKKLTRNKGALPQYYVENSHEGIIGKEEFQKANEILSSKTPEPPHPKDYEFKGMVFCGVCGYRYKRKKNYKKYIWCCHNLKNKGAEVCSSKQVPDSIIKEKSKQFEKEISKITVLPENKLTFTFADKSEETVIWEPPSRKWTAEMKENNYEALRRRYNNESKSYSGNP